MRASGVVVSGLSCSIACGIFPDGTQSCVPRINKQIVIYWAIREVPHFNGKWYLESKFWTVDVLIPIEMMLLPGKAKEYTLPCVHIYTQIHSLPSDTTFQSTIPQPSEESPPYPDQLVIPQARPPSLRKSSLSLGLWPALWVFMTSCLPSPPGTPTSLLHLMTLALNCLGGRCKRDHYWLWFKVLILVIVNSHLHIGCTCIWPIN